MKPTLPFFLTLTMGLLLTIGAIDNAEAKRFGGGRSFGGRSAYSNPYRRSVTPKRSLSQRQAAAKNQRLRDSFSHRGGLMGLLGGLALGGLLGSMLFGGAFEGLNFMDLLIFGLIAFVLYKLFAGRRTGAAATPAGDGYTGTDADFADDSDHYPADRANAEPYRRRSASFDTDLLFDKSGKTSASAPSTADTMSAAPSGFDEATFLDGARTAYERLQAAWDSGDLAEIRGLTTDAIFADIQQQLAERGGDNQTEILKLDAELLEVRETGDDWEATVLFDAILREERGQRPQQVREIWHFVRPAGSLRPTWFLDGIQQLED